MRISETRRCGRRRTAASRGRTHQAGMNASGSAALALARAASSTTCVTTTRRHGPVPPPDLFNTAGILYSLLDGGANWRELPPERPGAPVDRRVRQPGPNRRTCGSLSSLRWAEPVTAAQQWTYLESRDGGARGSALGQTSSLLPGAWTMPPSSGRLQPPRAPSRHDRDGPQAAFVTRDGGNTWTPHEPLTCSRARYEPSRPRRQSSAWLMHRNESNPELFESRDGGVT